MNLSFPVSRMLGSLMAETFTAREQSTPFAWERIGWPNSKELSNLIPTSHFPIHD
jgi:hypothetical protein